ncbi:hypothetical protein [Nonomuraea insulae]|uniref:Uncharacterized protein n=1 Tax=Nonomuraea insulae TaxID=1616787 RepID=A0ABW1D0P0_9ACTN
MSWPYEGLPYEGPLWDEPSYERDSYGDAPKTSERPDGSPQDVPNEAGGSGRLSCSAMSSAGKKSGRPCGSGESDGLRPSVGRVSSVI